MSSQVGIYKAGKQGIKPEEYVSKEYASTLVDARQARWINRGKDILLNKTPKLAASVEVYAAHSGKLGEENIPFDHVSPARAAYLMQKAKVERLDAQSIVISDRRMSNMMQWERYGRPERQKHDSRPKAPQLAERLAEGHASAKVTINVGWSNRAGVAFCPLIVKGDASPVATIDPEDLIEPKRVFEANYPPYPATKGLKRARDLQRFKINA